MPLVSPEGTPTKAAVSAAVDWPALLASAIAGDSVSAVYQPIIDVARATVAGYEALARFDHPQLTSPEEWFAAARRHGIADRLEAKAMEAAFTCRSSLPRNCFLTVNVSPGALASQPIRDVLDAQGDLGGVVIELTEQTHVTSYLPLEPYLERFRSAGAMIAVDDAGSGYAGLQHLLHLRPAIIKVDRHFVTGIHHDEAKRALVHMLGTFADRTDCWLLAEGVERVEELDVVAALEVPLVQGYLLGKPGPPWVNIAPESEARLRARQWRCPGETLRELLETTPSAATLEDAAALLASDPELDVVVIVDHFDRPVGVADPESVTVGVSSEAMRINLATPVGQAGRRAMARPRHSRFQPLVCTNNAGRYVGVVRMERIVERLSR